MGNTDFKWIKICSIVPEYGVYNGSEVDDILDWYFNFSDEVPQDKVKEFKQWLYDMPLGIVTDFPNQKDYKIVRVFFSPK